MSKPDLRAMFPHGSKDFFAGNAGDLRTIPHPRTVAIAPADAPAKPRIRQNSRGLNKTEQAFFDWLKMRNPSRQVLSQAVTLRIGNGVRYTPDFLAITDATNGHEESVCCIHAYEVKGFMRDDAAVKLKVAASAYPWIKFHLVTAKDRALTGWEIQEVRQ